MLSREALYERVWSEPVRTVAESFGLSDVGLRKICVRADHRDGPASSAPTGSAVTTPTPWCAGGRSRPGWWRRSAITLSTAPASRHICRTTERLNSPRRWQPRLAAHRQALQRAGRQDHSGCGRAKSGSNNATCGYDSSRGLLTGPFLCIRSLFRGLAGAVTSRRAVETGTTCPAHKLAAGAGCLESLLEMGHPTRAPSEVGFRSTRRIWRLFRPVHRYRR